MQTYELTYIIADSVADTATGTVMQEVTKELERLGGVIIKEEAWGKRRLAYPIKKNNYGTYVTLQTHLDGVKVRELDHFLGLHETVIRHLLLQAAQPTMKPTDDAELAEALTKRVEEKVSKKPKKEEVSETPTEPAAVAEAVVEEEVKPKRAAAPRRSSARAKSNETEKKEESEAERKKLVEEKLNEILGE